MAVNNQFLSGVVEGFYGQPWSMEERFELFDWLHGWGLNTYLYAPKDDLKHRAIWREPYSASEIRALQNLIQRAHDRGIQFVYALAPGLDIQYSSAAENEAVKHRFNQLLSIGCAHFALLFDDIPDAMKPEDKEHFESFAEAQALFANEICRWICQRSPNPTFLFCPTPYCGRMALRQFGGPDYLEIVGRILLPEIDVLWTGPEIISRTITIQDIPAKMLGRKPVIWDNLHANDYDRTRFFCGPYAGRDPRILSSVRGILSNPNNEFPLNFVPLRTLGMFLRNRGLWDPRGMFLNALREWEPRFATVREPITLDHLRAFADCHYLPHEEGPEAADLCASGALALTEGLESCAKEFRERAGLLREFCQRATELRDRRLFYALAQRVWDLREELDLLERCISRDARAAGQSFTSDFHLPKTYRGGCIRRLQRLLTQRKDGRFALSAGKSEFVIRDAVPGDEPGAYHVCLKTGDYGKDGERFYRNDPDALGRIFVGPYLAFEPEFSVLLEDDDGLCGYALGALDSRTFYVRYEREWRRKLCEEFPMPRGDPKKWTRLQQVHSWYHEPDYFCPEPYVDYPSHLHIDLLPRAQGRGFGRRMLEEVMRRLRERGSAGVHLGVSAVNPAAFEFYKHLGFTELVRVGTGNSEVIYMGKKF